MQTQTTRRPSPGEQDAALKQALLMLVVDDHPGLWTLEELDRRLQPAEDARGIEPTREYAADAVQQLYEVGLVHRFGEYVCASQAGLEAARIAGEI